MGGGADADLWSFNAEPVVRTIADCRTPVVAAIGHEDDTTLCEDVADRRAMTPTDAGVQVTPDVDTVCSEVADLEPRVDGAYHRFVADALAGLDFLPRLTPWDSSVGDPASRSPRL